MPNHDDVNSQKSNKDRDDNGSVTRVAADFSCFVCGAIFTTDYDRKQHLEKEAHGMLRDGTTEEERRIARAQEKINEDHDHIV